MIAYFLCEAAIIKYHIQFHHIQASGMWSSADVTMEY